MATLPPKTLLINEEVNHHLLKSSKLISIDFEGSWAKFFRVYIIFIWRQRLLH